MSQSDSRPNRDIFGYLGDKPPTPDTPSTDELAALRAIVEGTARHTGQKFFQSLVQQLAAAIGTHYAFVAVFAGATRARTLAFWSRDRITDNIEWDVVGTPCEDVVRGNLCHYPTGLSQRFPEDKLIADWGIESYLGVPLRDAQGRHLGHLAVFDERPMPAEPRKLFIFRIFAVRAAAELERLQYEERLRESEQRWRSLTEALPQLVWSATPNGAADYFSTQWTQYTGVSESDLLGWRWLEMLHPDDREPTRRLRTDSLAGRGPYDVEYRIRRADGVYRWFKTRGVPIRDSEGNIVKWIGTCTDITDLREIEEALRASEERFRLLAQSIPQKIFTANAKGNVDYFNQPWMEFTGLSFDQIKGWGWLQFIHPDDVEENVRRWQHSIDTGEPFQWEHRFRRADGVYRWHLSRALAMRDAEGRVVMWFGSNTDIDDQKRAAESFKQAKEAAEAANRAKDEFLANVSHEIRTPMNAILGMTELALDTLLTEDQRHYLMTVKSAADALLGILNDLLDFAKIEAGKLELDPADFSLRAAVGDTLRALAVRAHKKGLELIYQVQPGVPDALVGDAGRLRQILLNLVGNAIKFTEQGEVVVEVTSDEWRVTSKEQRPEDASEDSSFLTRHASLVAVHFSVRDTGIGIPPEKQARIFQAFEQEDSSTTRKYGGTGLGLTIAARLVALMGGQITVDSAPGRGSTFAFTARFGLQPHPPETTAASPPPVLRGLPVLIIDDNATNRHILEEWLGGWQMEPAAADDGVTAMAALWRGVAQSRPYPLALLDGRMPDIDGLALAAKIRQQPELAATRIILLTSGDRPGDLTRARQLGIAANLLKPLQPRELLETILRVMGHQAEPEGSLISWPAMRPAIPESLVGVPLRILAAEDNEFNRDLLEHMLVRLGLSAAMAVNGREALALLERKPFDLLLLDIHMPELDGFQVVGAIREREQADGGHLPVIALTARSRKEDRERCLRAGMDECLTKPFNDADLWAAIDRVLRRAAGRGMRDEKRTAVFPSSLIPHPSALGEGLLDPPVLLAACGGDAAMLRKMCRSLQSRVPEHLAAIRDALHDQDALRLREAAHKCYGVLSAFSAIAGDQAANLEDLADCGLLPEARPFVEQLDKCATELARLAGELTIESLQKQAKPANAPNRTASR
jgi:two-component system sensor histidine kinase/response regulator